MTAGGEGDEPRAEAADCVHARGAARARRFSILDEATANIDTVTEQLLEQILDELPATTTKVVIAHRLNTIENADEIFFINAGEITPRRVDGARARHAAARQAGYLAAGDSPITGFVTLIERLDTGTWGETTPDAMTARAAKLKAASSVDLGPSRFISHTPPEMLRPWDGTQWGTYAPPR